MTDQKLKQAAQEHANRQIISAANCCDQCYSLAQSVFSDPKAYGQRSFLDGATWQAEQTKELEDTIETVLKFSMSQFLTEGTMLDATRGLLNQALKKYRGEE
jgi:hypothetical protein